MRIFCIFICFSLPTLSWSKSLDETILSIPVLAKQYNDVSKDNLDDLISRIWESEQMEGDLIDKVVEKEEEKNVVYNKYESQNLNTLIDSISATNSQKKPVIIIDSGHGGKDPGAIGYARLKEKDLVLSYAKALKKKLKKNGKYKVFLTREKDVFLSLRGRNRVARNHKADLFISIHADSALNKKARGFSVYTLSEKASDKEAAALARKENQADVISGINLTGLEKDVSETLIDLSLRDTKNKSVIFAKILHRKLKDKVKLRSKVLHSAGFVVLKNPNMASVLLELGFLSNKTDAKNLRKRWYRNSLVNGIARAVDEYFVNY